jgi:hypothetical protein
MPKSMKPYKRTEKDKRAITANSLRRAESLSVTPAIMERYIAGDDKAIAIVDAWDPYLSWQDCIRLEPIHA